MGNVSQPQQSQAVKAATPIAFIPPLPLPKQACWPWQCYHGGTAPSSRVSWCCAEVRCHMWLWHCSQHETLLCFGAGSLSGHIGYSLFWIVTVTLKDTPIFWSQMNAFCSSSSLMPISSTINKLCSWSSLASPGWFMSSARNKSCWSFPALDSLQHCN